MIPLAIVLSTAATGHGLARVDALPRRMPAPLERPDLDGSPGRADPALETGKLPAIPPVPQARPGPKAQPGSTVKGGAGPETRRAAGGPMSAAEKACRVELRAIGAEFSGRPALSDPAGCRVDHPIALTALSKDVTIAPEAVMNCRTALAAARFMREHAGPLVQERFGSRLTEIAQASAYVCRPRNGTSKLSEHAFGNALDIASFTLADGRSIPVEASTDPTRREFLREIRARACGPFKTVLGPGSDADHATHLHFDLGERRNGGVYCQ